MFSNILKDLRNERDLTQQKVANDLQISRSVISNYEAGSVEPTLSVIKKLAQYFNVSSDYLLGLKDEIGAVIPYSFELNNQEKEVLDTFRAIPDNTKGVALTMLQSLAPRKEKSALNKRA